MRSPFVRAKEVQRRYHGRWGQSVAILAPHEKDRSAPRLTLRRASRGETPRRATSAKSGAPPRPAHPGPSPRLVCGAQSRKAAELSSLCAFAPLREKNNADPTTARSKSRSPPNLNRSRKAAKPQRAQHKRGRWGLPGRRHRRGTPSPTLRRPDRWRHPRPLCGSAPLRETNDAATTTARSKRRSPPNPNRSRRAAEPQSRRALLPLRLCAFARPNPRRAEARRPPHHREPKHQAPPRPASPLGVTPTPAHQERRGRRIRPATPPDRFGQGRDPIGSWPR